MQLGIRYAIRMNSHSQTATFRHGEDIGGGDEELMKLIMPELEYSEYQENK
ncbi:MAG: hypothetical protein WCF03_06675 [Nitrososphaeraceae archaeon]